MVDCMATSGSVHHSTRVLEECNSTLQDLLGAVQRLEQQVLGLVKVQADHASSLQEVVEASKQEVLQRIQLVAAPMRQQETTIGGGTTLLSRAEEQGEEPPPEAHNQGEPGTPGFQAFTSVISLPSCGRPISLASGTIRNSSSAGADDTYRFIPRQRVSCVLPLARVESGEEAEHNTGRRVSRDSVHGRVRRGAAALPRCNLFGLLPLSPHGLPRLLVDVCSFLLLLYDAIAVPYYLAWQVEDTAVTITMRVITCSFWTTDLLISFASSRTTDSGVLVDNWHGIALHYVRTWFIADLLLLLVDWLDFILNNGSATGTGSFRGATLLRVTRVLRLGRMLRIVVMILTGRLSNLPTLLMTRARYLGIEAFVKVMLPMMQILFLIIWLTHVGACIYFAFLRDSRGASDTALSWRDTWSEMSQVDDFITAMPESYLYSSSVYWTLVTLGAAESPEYPSNTAEAWFAYVYVFVGLLIQSSLVSSLSARLVDFNIRHQHRQREVSKLHRFLLCNNIETALAARIMCQVTVRLRETPSVTVEDVPALSVLSLELREELHLALYGPMIVAKHRLLRVLGHIDEFFMRSLCYSALRLAIFEPGAVVLNPDEEATHAMLVHRGDVSYRRRALSKTGEQLAPGTWICEMTLWLVWTTLGTADVRHTSEVLQISEQDFSHVIRTCPDLPGLVSEYSRAFADGAERERPRLTDVGALIDHYIILKLMSQLARELVRAPALKALGHVSSKQLAKLENAVQNEVELVLDADGKTFLVTLTAVLHVTRSDGFLWIELGECGSDSDGFQLTLHHPSAVLKGGETPREAMERFMMTEAPRDVAAKMPPEWHRNRTIETVVEGSRHHVPTKWCRTIFQVELSATSTENLQCMPLDVSSILETAPHQKEDARSDLHRWDICMAASDSRCRLFAWMSEKSFSALATRSSGATQALREKLEHLKGQQMHVMQV